MPSRLVSLATTHRAHAAGGAAFDFLVAGVLLFGTAAAYEVVSRISASQAYRAGAALALMTGLVLVWVNLAVGLIGMRTIPPI